MKLECCEATPCNWYRSHDRTRPNSGETGRADRGSIYGDYFCFLLTNAGARLFGHVRTLEEDLATGDGRPRWFGLGLRGGLIQGQDGHRAEADTKEGTCCVTGRLV